MLLFFHIGLRQQDENWYHFEEATFRRSTSAMRSDPKPGLPDGDGYHDMILPCGLFQEIPIWKKVLFFCCLKCLNGRGLVWEDVKQDYFFGVKERSSFVQFAVDFLQFVSFLKILILICIGFTLVSNVLDDCNTCDL